MLHIEQLRRLGACEEGAEFARHYDTLAGAWAECVTPSWMLWLLSKTGSTQMELTLTACAIARRALRFVPAGEDRPLCAIEAAEGWTRGEVPIEAVRTARANALRCRAAVAAVAYAAADAAYAAVDAAAYAAADAAERKAIAGLIRERHPCPNLGVE